MKARTRSAKSFDPAGRIQVLERRLLRVQVLLASLILLFSLSILLALAPSTQPVRDEFRAKRIVVVDDEGVPRVVIGQDPPDTQRRSRSAGITIHDRHGHERGGMGTMDDDSVILALDAPVGVGAPMRDRIGMVVGPNGASSLLLIDNQTRGVVRLFSDSKGEGGVQLFKWESEKLHTKTLAFDGESTKSEARRSQ